MNIITLLGRLTKDPVFSAQQTFSTCKFTLAVDRRFKNKDGGKEADFIQIVTFNKLAELCGNYLEKGRQCAVVGRLQVRSYDKDGQKVWVSEVIADQVQFIGSKSQAPDINDVGTEISLDENIPYCNFLIGI